MKHMNQKKLFTLPRNYKEFNADLWLENLRSGEFSQGGGVLIDVCRNFCCLGVADCGARGLTQQEYISVACDASFPDEVDGTPLPEELHETSTLGLILSSLNDGVYYHGFSSINSADIVNSIEQYVKDVEEEEFDGKKYIVKKIKLNFNEIADWIEKYVEFID